MPKIHESVSSKNTTNRVLFFSTPSGT